MKRRIFLTLAALCLALSMVLASCVPSGEEPTTEGREPTEAPSEASPTEGTPENTEKEEAPSETPTVSEAPEKSSEAPEESSDEPEETPASSEEPEGTSEEPEGTSEEPASSEAPEGSTEETPASGERPASTSGEESGKEVEPPANPLVGEILCEDGLEYQRFANGGYSMLGPAPDSEPVHVVIPSEIAGEPVVCVEYRAFWECYTLKSLVIPTSVTQIGESALGYCTALEELTLPFLGKTAAAVDAKPLSWLMHYPPEPPCGCGYVFPYEEFENRSLRTLTVTGGKWILPYVLDGCRAIESLTLHTEIIGESAFDSYETLTHLYLGEGVRRIEYGAFAQCGGLEEVLVPASLERIAVRAFFEDYGIDRVYYGGDAYDWENLAFLAEDYNASLMGEVPALYSETPPEDTAGDGAEYWRYVDGLPVLWSAAQ